MSREGRNGGLNDLITEFWGSAKEQADTKEKLCSEGEGNIKVRIASHK